MKINPNIKKEIWQWGICICTALVVSLTLKTYVFARAVVNGPSMMPTLKTNDSLITENISTRFAKIKRGEIITFNSQDANQDRYIKRVIGIAGDKIEITDGKVYLNGKELEEPYLNKGMLTWGGTYLHENQEIKIKEGYVFVLGDNRTVSNDSRYFGPVKIKEIKGHAILRVYPFNKINHF
jgi:signal peptidase I